MIEVGMPDNQQLLCYILFYIIPLLHQISLGAFVVAIVAL